MSESVIYFVERKSDGAIKIGTSKKLSTRMKQIARKHGSLEILGIMSGSKKEERTIQRFFKSFKIEQGINKEYFYPEAPIIRFIAKNCVNTENKIINAPKREENKLPPNCISNTDAAIVLGVSSVTIKNMQERGEVETPVTHDDIEKQAKSLESKAALIRNRMRAVVAVA